MKFMQAWYSDQGPVRTSNEDSLLLMKADTRCGEVLLAVVSDGMGGYASGELASKHLVSAFADWFEKTLPVILGDANADWQMTVLQDWNRLLRAANAELLYYGGEHHLTLGCTVTAFLFCRGTYMSAQVGDSRGYCIGADGAVRLTRDQSLVEQELEHGLITEEEAKTDARRNILLESVGVTEKINAVFNADKIETDRVYLLCSDGFWHNLENEELSRVMMTPPLTDGEVLREKLKSLIEMDLERGEKDNISVLAVVPYEEQTEVLTEEAEEGPTEAGPTDAPAGTEPTEEAAEAPAEAEPAEAPVFTVTLAVREVHTEEELHK